MFLWGGSTIRAALALIVTTGLMLVGGASAAEALSLGVITEFSAGLNSHSSPADIVSGPDGNLWFTDDGSTKAIGRITPNGSITEFNAGLNPGSSPEVLVSGPDGNVWFVDRGSTKAIGRITPSGSISEFSAGLNPGSSPAELVSGPGGNMWFTDAGVTKAIGLITTSATTVAPSGAGASGGTGGKGGTGGSTTSGTCRVSLLSRRIIQSKKVPAIKLRYAGSASTCSGRLALTITVKMTIKKGKQVRRIVRIGTASFVIRAGKTTVVSLKLNARGQALLRAGHGHLNARLTILRLSPGPSQAEAVNVTIAPKAKAKKPKS
jgi:hypothetical protein